MALMFGFTVVGWIIFRSRSVDQITQMILRIGWATSPETKGLVQRLIFFVAPLVAMQVWQYRARDLLVMAKQRPIVLGLAYGLAIVWMFIFGVRESLEFIYFQF